VNLYLTYDLFCLDCLSFCYTYYEYDFVVFVLNVFLYYFVAIFIVKLKNILIIGN